MDTDTDTPDKDIDTDIKMDVDLDIDMDMDMAFTWTCVHIYIYLHMYMDGYQIGELGRNYAKDGKLMSAELAVPLSNKCSKSLEKQKPKTFQKGYTKL